MSVYTDMASAQFENVNGLRSYPFAEGSTLEARDGKILPENVVVDLHMVVPSAGAALPVVVRMSSVHISPYMVSVCFTSTYWGKDVAASVTVARDRFSPYVPYMLGKLAGTEDMGGVVTFGDLEFPAFPETYFLPGAVVHPCCVAPARPVGLKRFVDERSGESVSGDAEIVFSGYVDAKRSGRSFSLSLADGAERTLASECASITGPEACGATPIASINGVRPDSDGNIVLWFH